MPALVMRANQHATVTAAPRNGTQPGTLSGSPTWTTDNATLVDIVPTGDPFTVTVKGKGVPGDCNVFCNAVAVPFGPSISTPQAVSLTALPADHFEYTLGSPADN